jgi:hypothetical protein
MKVKRANTTSQMCFDEIGSVLAITGFAASTINERDHGGRCSPLQLM